MPLHRRFWQKAVYKTYEIFLSGWLRLGQPCCSVLGCFRMFSVRQPWCLLLFLVLLPIRLPLSNHCAKMFLYHDHQFSRGARGSLRLLFCSPQIHPNSGMPYKTREMFECLSLIIARPWTQCCCWNPWSSCTQQHPRASSSRANNYVHVITCLTCVCMHADLPIHNRGVTRCALHV